MTELSVIAGPDAGRSLVLGVGRHLIGRAAGVGQLLDPMIEAHHAMIDIAADGGVELLQLTGRFPVRVDGQPATGWMAIAPGSVIELGHSRLRLGSAALTEPDPGDVDVGWRRERLGDEPGVDHAPMVAIDFAKFDRVAITGPHGDQVAVSIGSRLADRHGWNVTVLADAEGPVSVPVESATRQLVICRVGDVVRHADLWERDDVSALVIVAAHNRVPDVCRSLLAVSETWHGEWWPDRHGAVTDVVRLHLCGTRRPLLPTPPDRRPMAPPVARRSSVAARCAVRRRTTSPVRSGRERCSGVRRSSGSGHHLRAPPQRHRGSTGRTT